VLEYFALKKQATKAAETDQQQAAAQFHAQAERIISEAKAMNQSILDTDVSSNKARTQGIRANRQSLKLHERKRGLQGLSSVAALNELAPVIPIKPTNKRKDMQGYVPPARPYDEIREVQEELRKRDK
jgi:hypothetical protein